MYKWLTIILAVFLVSGCGINNNSRDNDKNARINVENTTIENVNRKNGQDISKHLVKLASSIPGVNDATAVVLGKYAIVGIDVKDNIERSQVGSIKYSVAESLKKDPYGATAIVVADPDMTARLKEISDDIKNGKPIQGIMNELADISGRLIPEVPADIIDPNQKSPTNEPKRKQGKKDNQKLEKEQDKQSNYHKD